MQALTRIVAATDFSPSAERAVLRATLIARQQGAELHLLHVVPPLALYPGMEISPDSNAYAAAAERAAAGSLDALASGLRERYGIPVHTAQRIGRAHTRIAEYAAAVSADLVVVGARGENPMLRLLLGSTAWRLLRVRRGPVLIVKYVPVGLYRQPLAAVDFYPDSRAALAWAARLAADGRVDVLHVLPEEDEKRLRGAGLDSTAIRQRGEDMRVIAGNLMAGLLADLPAQATPHIETGQAAAMILERAAEWRSGLIVLGRHGTGGLEEYLLGSVSKDVAQAADCDVLLAGKE